MRRSRSLVLLLAVLLVMPVAAEAQSLGEVRAERDRIQERLDAAAEELSALETRAAELEEEQLELSARLEGLSAVVAEADARVQLRVRELYKGGSADPIVLLLSGGAPEEAVERAVLVGRLVEGDRRDAERADVARAQLRAVVDRLDRTEEELASAAAAERDRQEQLEVDLERAQQLERKLEAEERRRREEQARRAAAAEAQRRAAATRSTRSSTSSTPSSSGGGRAVTTGGMACPVARPHSFTDTWGAPRSGGRSHKGTDILAPRGQTVIAIVSGTWDVRSYGASAGNWAILRGNDGNHYYYMHLERHVAGDGARVSAGQQVATNGDTGNARGTPHVHFELHPGGGSAINPYPTLKRVCG